MKYYFGAPISLTVTLHGVTSAMAPEIVTARVYSEKPTDNQYDEGVNTGLQEITSWTNVGTGVYSLDFADIVDDEPTDYTGFEYLWVVLRFRYNTGEPVKYLIKSFKIYRPEGWLSEISATTSDLTSRERDFESFFSTSEMDAFISDAEEWILDAFESEGLEVEKLGNLSRLKLASVYFALAQGCRSLYGDNSTVWGEKAEFYLAEAKAKLDASKPDFDTDGDGQITESEQENKSLSLKLVQR